MLVRHLNRRQPIVWNMLLASVILALAVTSAIATDCEKCQSTTPAWPNLLSGAGRRAAMSLPASSPLHLDPTLEDIEMGEQRLSIAPKAEYKKWRQHIEALPPNVRANNPAGDAGPPSADTQSECAIAAQGQNVVVAWNDSKGFTAGNTVSSYAWSCDGGVTFTDGGNVPLALVGDQAYGDCTLDVDASGNFYLAQIYVTGGLQEVAVHRGTFSGCSFSWGTPVIAVTVPSTSQAIDKPYLTCDKANGNLYLSYSRFSTVVAIEVVRGTALGTVWSAPVILDNTTSGIQGSRPIVGPEGNLYVCWQAGWGSIYCDMSSPTGSVLLRRCTAPTAPTMAFDPTVTVGSAQMNWMSYWAGNLRANALHFPDMAVDRAGASPYNGYVYVTWNEAAPWGAPTASGLSTAETESNNNANDANVKTIAVGDNATGSISTTADLDYWKLTATAGQHVMLRLEPQGFNCGVTSTSRNFRLRLYKGNTPTAGDSILGNSNLSNFASEIVWDMPETGTYFFRVQNMRASGTTTGTYTVKSRALTYGTPSPGRDMRDVVVARSTNLGVSFQPEVLANDDAAGQDNCIPAITVDGCGLVHAFWYDNRDEQPSHILRSYYRGVSSNGGLSFVNQRVSNQLMYFNLNTLAIPNYGEYNQAYGDGSRVYASWSDERLSNANTSGVDTYIAVMGGCDRVPVEVSDLAVTAGERGVSLSWRLSPVAQRELRGVRVQRADDIEGPYANRTGQDLVPGSSMSFDDEAVEAGRTYWYRLQLVSADGTLTAAGPIRVVVGDMAGLRTALATPAVSGSGPVEIRFSLGRASGAARLDVFDISGRLVRSLAQGMSRPGQYLRTWDRRDDRGADVARGVYLIRLQAGSTTDAKKLVLVRE